MKLRFFKRKQKATPPPIRPDMKYSFDDMDGKRYYTYPDELNMPAVRLWKIEEYMIWMTRGLSGEQLGEITDQMDKLLTEGLKTGKNAAKLGMLITELTERSKKIAPMELMLNYLAASYIREDEDPWVFSDEIQMQKVEAFKKGADSNAAFFLQIPEYGELCRLLNITTDKWTTIVSESLKANQRHEKLLKITSPAPQSSESEKETGNSI